MKFTPIPTLNSWHFSFCFGEPPKYKTSFFSQFSDYCSLNLCQLAAIVFTFKTVVFFFVRGNKYIWVKVAKSTNLSLTQKRGGSKLSRSYDMRLTFKSSKLHTFGSKLIFGKIMNLILGSEKTHENCLFWYKSSVHKTSKYIT